MTSFRTVLVANRGEIACRVIRGARALGYRTAAVYSDADAGALHVSLADVAARIGPAPPAESYLRMDAILDAARRTGSDAVHPGYGFLSENAAFARACAGAGLVFIGPPPDAIALMGNKSVAKRRMIEAGVPTIPGWHGEVQDEASLAQAARALGYPLLVKAAAGGGGRGMRLVRAEQELLPSLRAAREEAEAAFGSGELLLERALVSARHVEIQVFGDTHGQVIHLGERDCSVQRRHQKIVEESPSPAVTPALRAAMGAAAVAAAKSIGYVGAGTVEFLLDGDGSFYFLEMNTRLQVEHPVTEGVTGLDLVALQLEVAAGKPLPLAQEEVRLEGHAIEVRLYAEDPYGDERGAFLPQAGTALRWRPGVDGTVEGRVTHGMRVDHGLIEGQVISPWYDPMLAKLIAHGADREQARRRLLRLLEDTTLLGVTSNKGFLADVLAHPAFVRGEATTRFIAEHLIPEGGTAPERPAIEGWVDAVAALLLSRGGAAPFQRSTTGEASWSLRLARHGATRDALVRVLDGDAVEVTIGGERTTVRVAARGDDYLRVVVDEVLRTVRHARDGARLHLDLGLRAVEYEEVPAWSPRREAVAGDGMIRATMNGRVVAVLVQQGARVERGQTLVTLEAMKMQHPIAADTDGTVAEVLVNAGDQVATRKLLVRIAPDPSP